MPVDLEALASELGSTAAADWPYEGGRFEGRGVVICAGGARLFTCAWVCVGMLRRYLGCTLPIEVWHIGPEEMGPPMRSLMEEWGTHVVDACEVAKRYTVDKLGGWELKSYALLHSRFREVLLLDADNIPVREPSSLFDRPEFQETGAMFWPDTMRLSDSNRIWSIARLAPYTGRSFESGQVVLDKQRCWRALALANWMNQRSDAFYELLHGDKDTFLIAWLLLNQPFHLIQHPPKLLESTICQRDPDGRILFQHRHAAKWVLQGVNPVIEGFQREAECRGLLAELAGIWDGRIFNPPSRSETARALERQLADERHFRFVCISSDERPMELLHDNRIGAGAQGREFYWYVANDAEGPQLTIQGGNYRSCVLRRCADGVWRGRLLYAPGTPVELLPLGPNMPPSSTHAADTQSTLLFSLLDRALAAFVTLPRDEVVTRDLTGFFRILSALDPAVVRWWRAELKHWPSTSRQAEVLQSALDGLVQQTQAGAIERGHNWNTRRYPSDGYQPADLTD